MTEGLISKDLFKRYGRKEVVQGVTLNVQPGEIVGLLGPNGAGKTTSFYMIVGLVPPSKGHIFLGAEDITHLPMHKRARQGIGYLPQEPSVFRKLSVRNNIKAIVELLPLNKTDREAHIEKSLAELGLTEVANQKAYTLSGGERRRLEITRALITKPKFLLMDEPFSGVDPINVHEVQAIIRKLKSQGIGILITDHNVRETLEVVDRAYLMHEGKILYQGTSQNLVEDPKSREFYLGKHFHL